MGFFIGAKVTGAVKTLFSKSRECEENDGGIDEDNNSAIQEDEVNPFATAGLFMNREEQDDIGPSSAPKPTFAANLRNMFGAFYNTDDSVQVASTGLPDPVTAVQEDEAYRLAPAGSEPGPSSAPKPTFAANLRNMFGTFYNTDDSVQVASTGLPDPVTAVQEDEAYRLARAESGPGPSSVELDAPAAPNETFASNLLNMLGTFYNTDDSVQVASTDLPDPVTAVQEDEACRLAMQGQSLDLHQLSWMLQQHHMRVLLQMC